MASKDCPEYAEFVTIKIPDIQSESDLNASDNSIKKNENLLELKTSTFNENLIDCTPNDNDGPQLNVGHENLYSDHSKEVVPKSIGFLKLPANASLHSKDIHECNVGQQVLLCSDINDNELKDTPEHNKILTQSNENSDTYITMSAYPSDCDDKTIHNEDFTSDLDFPQAGSSKDHTIDLSQKSIMSEIGNTPSFKKGVMFSSTPTLPPAKRLKYEMDVLSVIEEVDSLHSLESSIIENIPLLSEEVRVETPELKDSLSKNNVLQRDELSMDFYSSKSQHKMREDLQNDKQDITIVCKNDLTIVYDNLKDRTLDEVQLKDGNINNEMEIMYNLDCESDRENILEKAKNLQVFISNDAQENKDNFDPEWEVLKKLETDDERYKVVRKLWMNLDMPDPKENLSTFNWRKRNQLRPPTTNQLTRPANKNTEDKNTYYCTEVFDVAIEKLKTLYDQRQKGLYADGICDKMISSNTYNHCFQGVTRRTQSALRQLDSFYTENLHKNLSAKQEIEAIHKFYNDLKNRGENSSNLLYLTHKERQDILDVESIISSYSSWYTN